MHDQCQSCTRKSGSSFVRGTCLTGELQDNDRVLYDWPPRNDADPSNVLLWKFVLNSNQRFLIQRRFQNVVERWFSFFLRCSRRMLFSLWSDFLQVDHTLDNGEMPVKTNDAGPGRSSQLWRQGGHSHRSATNRQEYSLLCVNTSPLSTYIRHGRHHRRCRVGHLLHVSKEVSLTCLSVACIFRRDHKPHQREEDIKGLWKHFWNCWTSD